MTIKARRSGAALWTSSRGVPAYRFALAYAPPLVAGFVPTPVFAATDLMARLPGCWLLLYGTALAAGGALSVRIVALMGAAFMALGAIAFAAPAPRSWRSAPSRSRRRRSADTSFWPPASAACTSDSVS